MSWCFCVWQEVIVASEFSLQKSQLFSVFVSLLLREKYWELLILEAEMEMKGDIFSWKVFDVLNEVIQNAFILLFPILSTI